MTNRLATETSPYLQQHAGNPVDWYPWGDEAFDLARREDRPILLSVGYAACHWCHVMAHESFEDVDTARVMNAHFVNVKVDREERPDVDGLYMDAVQQLTGHGGWPMTVFLTPAGEPFYGGTYFPPQPRHGLPAFRELLQAVADAWRDRRDDVVRSASTMREALAQATSRSFEPGAPDAGLLAHAVRGFAAQFDARWGGFGRAPKFPQPMNLEFLLRAHRRRGDADALRMADATLERMWRGGMYDHLGGGFHRYSVDERWLVPHFEKMLYDNALLARAYLHAWQLTRNDAYRRVAEHTIDYVLREMTSPEGAFHASQDADSEGEEGRFYVWTPAQIDEVLGAADGAIARRWYGVSEAGNFEGRNVLHLPRDAAERPAGSAADRDADRVAHRAAALASELGIGVAQLDATIERARRALYDARAKRVWPARDEKIVTAWNAMMLATIAEAAAVLERADYRAAAERNASFLVGRLRVDGRLKRSWRDGVARIDAFLDDHALLADALLEVYQATFDARWIDEARALADEILARFHDGREHRFYDTAIDGEALIVRPRAVFDNAVPSGTSAAITALLRLAAYTGDARCESAAVGAMHALTELVRRAPSGFGQLLCAIDAHLGTPQAVALVGDPASEALRAMLAVLRHGYRPDTIVALRTPGDDASIEQRVPLLAGRAPADARATAYVCERFVCRRPVHDAQALETELASTASIGR